MNSTISHVNGKDIPQRVFEEGVCILLHTLNDEDDVGACLESILQSRPNQIVVADGSSSDRTVEIAKRYTDEVYVTPPGFVPQQKVGFSKLRFKYMIIIECDQRYPPGFIESLRKEFEGSGYFGLQASLICTLQRNFFERGMAAYYEILQEKKGDRSIIGGPALYHTEEHIRLLTLESFEGFCGDTQKAEIVKAHGLRYGLAHTVAHQHQALNGRGFFRKFFKYGKGDYVFYTGNRAHWSWQRKFKSITHIVRQYGILFPFKALRRGNFEAILFFWLIMLVRYSGWVTAILQNNLRRPKNG